QQPQGVEPALLDRACRPRQLRGPTQLALDLLDELADLRGGGFRLLALNADQRGLVLLIVEEDVERAVGEERDADQHDEQRDVFGEQAAAGFRRRNGGARVRLPARSRGGLTAGNTAREEIAKAHSGQFDEGSSPCNEVAKRADDKTRPGPDARERAGAP